MTTFAIALTSVIIIAAVISKISQCSDSDYESNARTMWKFSTISDVRITNTTSDFVSADTIHWTRF